MQIAETMAFWCTTIFYAFAFMLFVVAVVHQKTGVMSKGVAAVVAGYTMHTLALSLRWMQTGYPPFVEFFESVSASIWFGVLIYLVLQSYRPAARAGGVFVSGLSVLLLGWAGSPTHANGVLSASLQSTWLFVHASFATAGVGCLIVAAGVSMVWLLRNRPGQQAQFGPGGIGVLDEIVFRLVLTGFLFYTVMILSGAIWANQAWGRYWGWDPIETWSLLTWFVYAVYLHLHYLFRSLRGRFLVWYAILAVFLAAFSLWGVGYVAETIHTYG
jgi:cytochrome c-type biogenesis protein CcsB